MSTLGERQARAVLAEIGTAQAAQAFDPLAATMYARARLDGGIHRRTIAYRLVARYDISLKSAYRRISGALND